MDRLLRDYPSIEEMAKMKAARNKNAPPQRANYPNNAMGDLEFEFAQDRYVMERSNMYDQYLARKRAMPKGG